MRKKTSLLGSEYPECRMSTMPCPDAEPTMTAKNNGANEEKMLSIIFIKDILFFLATCTSGVNHSKNSIFNVITGWNVTQM